MLSNEVAGTTAELALALAGVAVAPLAGRLVAGVAAGLPDRWWVSESRTGPAMAAAIGIALWAVAALPAPLAPLGCLLGWILLTLALIDARCRLLPDCLTLPLIGIGLALAAAAGPDLGLPTALPSLFAAVTGYCAFAGLGYAYQKLRGRDGLGLGDAKLLAAGGAWCGPAALPSVVMIAAISGLLVAMWARVQDSTRKTGGEVAFGPHLALATWLVWLYGPLDFAGSALH